jgi:hypothetical protein
MFKGGNLVGTHVGTIKIFGAIGRERESVLSGQMTRYIFFVATFLLPV